MRRDNRLELTWHDKYKRHKLEPRILLEDAELSYAARARVTENDLFDNRLIRGDNLLALKALEQEFTGKVKCVYIDPPYNTGSAFQHYDDGVEHSLWLSLMRDRLELLRRLLTEDGSIWITLDDNEAHYCKVLCDEIFGRANFVANVVWQKKYSPQNDAQFFSAMHDHIIVYAKNAEKWQRNLLLRTEKQDKAYKNPDNDLRGLWKASDLTRSEHRDRDYYGIVTPSGKTVFPASGRSWSRPKNEIDRLREDNRLWFGKNGDAIPSLKRFLSEVKQGVVPSSIWFRDEVGDNEEAKREVKQFNSTDIFATPKPERLIQRVLQLATNEGDLVLDSFAGSGTTGAVAHKMRRRWIMVELGEHAETHIVPRLRKVVDGADAGGVTAQTNWTGGGGFRFFRLAPSLVVRDRWGMEIINREYQPEMLAEAMCKLMNFTYAPSENLYWQHGRSTERDFIYVTTQTLTHAQLAALSEEIGEERSLLVCCAAFRANTAEFPNLTVKKIPHAVLDRCEWGKDDYSLKIANLPLQNEPRNTRNTLKKEKTEKAETNGTPSLF